MFFYQKTRPTIAVTCGYWIINYCNGHFSHSTSVPHTKSNVRDVCQASKCGGRDENEARFIVLLVPLIMEFPAQGCNNKIVGICIKLNITTFKNIFASQVQFLKSGLCLQQFSTTFLSNGIQNILITININTLMLNMFLENIVIILLIPSILHRLSGQLNSKYSE